MKKQLLQSTFKNILKDREKTRQEYLFLMTFYFFAASLSGFLWEILIFYVKEGHFRNRGFLYGPWLPVYGTGAVLMYLLLSKQKRCPVKVFLYSVLLGTSLEWIIGWILDFFWDLRYWDYTGYLLNFRGYICLASALGIGIAGVLWICLFSGLLENLWFRIPQKTGQVILTTVFLLFILDCIAALIFPNTGRGITFPE
ncbi:MAG: putative ABC transporter permease [Lachnospiraceae bacterium]|jgi:uncharacterized membrane protein|nr:putative ABC transporter permease [Lachnospiraceae bacterium]